MTDPRPVGVFDSGVGGLSVLMKLEDLLPEEDFIYLGDRKNSPYGTKSHAEVGMIAEKNVDMLVGMGCKAIVIACNTATAAAVEPMRQKYPDVIIIGIEPAVKPAVDAGCRRVLVLATPRTVSEPRFSALLEARRGNSELIGVPCERLAGMIEAGDLDKNGAETYFCELLAPYMKTGSDGDPVPDFDGIVLGCTHYPFAIEGLRAAVGDGIPVFDGAEGTARHTGSCLERAGMRETGRRGKITFLSSDGNDVFLADFYRNARSKR